MCKKQLIGEVTCGKQRTSVFGPSGDLRHNGVDTLPQLAQRRSVDIVCTDFAFTSSRQTAARNGNHKKNLDLSRVSRNG
jgi:hypothetical protein